MGKFEQREKIQLCSRKISLINAPNKRRKSFLTAKSFIFRLAIVLICRKEIQGKYLGWLAQLGSLAGYKKSCYGHSIFFLNGKCLVIYLIRKDEPFIIHLSKDEGSLNSCKFSSTKSLLDSWWIFKDHLKLINIFSAQLAQDLLAPEMVSKYWQ